MTKITTLILILPVLAITACAGKRPSAAPHTERYNAGDRATAQADINGDKVAETLTVTSAEPKPEFAPIGPFDISIEITNPRGNVLYSGNWEGQGGWFSVDVALFEIEGSGKRECVLIRSPHTGTGTHMNALFLFYPKGADHAYTLDQGNEGFYDSDSSGVADMLVSVYRCDRLGGIGATSPYLPFFTRPSRSDDWSSQDVTFAVLARDASYREQWIEGVAETVTAIQEFDGKRIVSEDHMRYLGLLKEALQRNDAEEAGRIYNTGF